MREADGIGQAAVTSTAQLQARVTQSNEAVERLSNENRQLTGSLATQNQQAINELAHKDAEIQRLSEFFSEKMRLRERVSIEVEFMKLLVETAKQTLSDNSSQLMKPQSNEPLGKCLIFQIEYSI